MRTWYVYVALVTAAIVSVIVLKLNAAIVAGIVIAAVVLTHLLLGERVCIDCGTQWRSSGKR